MQWWSEWLPTWNSSAIIPETRAILSSDLCLFTDASGKGLGAIYGDQWIQADWQRGFADEDIDFKEAFAIVAAACKWGYRWPGRRLVFVTDNKPFTEIWEKGSTPSPAIMKLVRKLFLIAVHGQFSVAFKHIEGQYNPVADALSRFQERRFRLLHPTADAHPTNIPPEAWNLHSHHQVGP